MMIYVAIGVISLIGIGAFFVFVRVFGEKEESNIDSIKERIGFVQESFVDQGAIDQRTDEGEGISEFFMNIIASNMPVATPEKMDKLNKAGVRHDKAYESKIAEQIAFAFILFVVGAVIGPLAEEPLLSLLLAPLMGYAGYHLPWLSLDSEIEKRSYYIDKHIPDLIDTFANACAAGTTLDMAADFVLYQLPDNKPEIRPIKEDFLAWQQDIKFGVDRPEAWTRLHQRSKSKNVKYFANLMDQSEKTGGSVGEALLKLADFFRERRKQMIEAEIAQLSGKLTGLTIAFIVLPILVFMILPIGIQVAGQMSGVFG